VLKLQTPMLRASPAGSASSIAAHVEARGTGASSTVGVGASGSYTHSGG